VVHFGDVVAKSGQLATVPGEICDFLVTFDPAYSSFVVD
jgi:hypothetical protein